jgi:glucokinase
VPEPLWLQEEMAREDPSIAITEAALKMRDAVCREVLNLFISNYGAEAGNLALKFMATGGVFIGGGIAITILHKLQETTFMKAFTAKGRLAGLLSTIPVKVISDPLTPLYGAALAASLLVNNAMTSDPKSDFVRR